MLAWITSSYCDTQQVGNTRKHLNIRDHRWTRAANNDLSNASHAGSPPTPRRRSTSEVANCSKSVNASTAILHLPTSSLSPNPAVSRIRLHRHIYLKSFLDESTVSGSAEGRYV
ncbi:hypothetical protein HETIRDRAFT_332220 [Heterobasidion irregulare TC 32-1]|uniref:Uncharacterized protein n=1 Tax=Heterobasidion irregulare (strain TC 32-1) TaxID=747525 RepID=W4JNM8_HETIT|nr:uncharacterized protein HETIRDRAFT_332220 [Heterobasidion irregulare TC 32-1]ETW74670.1 hypothetical protein HETIRDRAFT_332220 [Heterobasidion irregulare TC 32-1]